MGKPVGKVGVIMAIDLVTVADLTACMNLRDSIILDEGRGRQKMTGEGAVDDEYDFIVASDPNEGWTVRIETDRSGLPDSVPARLRATFSLPSGLARLRQFAGCVQGREHDGTNATLTLSSGAAATFGTVDQLLRRVNEVWD